MQWARVLSALLGCAGLALLAARVTGVPWELGPSLALVIGAAAGVASVRIRRAPLLLHSLLGAAAVVVSALATALVSDGAVGDAFIGLVRGPRQILTTEWPSPRWPTLLVALSAVTAAATYLAVALSIRLRWRLAPLLPVAVAFVALVAAAAPGGKVWPPAVLLAVSAALLALLRRAQAARLSVRSVGGLAVGVAVAVALVVVNADAVRSDPRSITAPLSELSVVDPISEVIAQRRAEETIDLYRVTTDDGSLPRRWRTAVVGGYTGEGWTVAGAVRPVGLQISSADEADTQVLQVELLRSDQTLLAVPGRLVRSDLSLATDVDRTLFRVLPGARSGDIEVVRVDDLPATFSGRVGSVQPSEAEQSFSQVAISLAGAGSPAEKITTLSDRMRTDFELDDSVGGGMQQPLLTLFLNDTRRGTTEQFVSGFVLMARSLGIDARVATGYELSDLAAGLITTDDASMWVEVRTDDGYRAVDVLPEPAVEEPDEPDLPQTGQAPPAVQPPDPPQSEETDDEEIPETVTPPPAPTWWDRVRPWVLRATLGLAALVLLGVAATLMVLVVKARRRSGLRNGPPESRIRRAWTLATDELVDAKVPLRPNDSTRAIADAGATAFPQAAAAMSSLALIADRATFSARPCAPEHADFAVALLTDVQDGMRLDTPWRERVRRTMSPRSLLPGSRSPLRRHPRARRLVTRRAAARPTTAPGRRRTSRTGR
jgi:transglutaminase-like putative cysteine protease